MTMKKLSCMTDVEKREHWRKWNEKRHQETLRMMSRELKDLTRFTKACREDMHEPDEHEISAKIVGNHLDNACGNYVGDLDKGHQEFVVILKNGKGKTLNVNLASLIALARKAKIE